MLDKLWPISARVDGREELWLGGCAVSKLAETFGTPLYIFDEATLRTRARAYQEALRRHYPASAQAAYASKAYLCLATAQLFEEEGLDLDVVSGGELYVALQAGFPAERIHFHGNNKSPDELAQALAAGVGRIVVDNFHELGLLTELLASAPPASSFQLPVRIWLRLSPGVQAHTHAHIQTGQVDTKFGFDIKSGDAERALVAAMQIPGL
jgi:diaminopimelate decarboxylase